jgi:hypothetical protein
MLRYHTTVVGLWPRWSGALLLDFSSLLTVQLLLMFSLARNQCWKGKDSGTFEAMGIERMDVVIEVEAVKWG